MSELWPSNEFCFGSVVVSVWFCDEVLGCCSSLTKFSLILKFPKLLLLLSSDKKNSEIFACFERCITRPPTTDSLPTTNNRPPTHRQVLHRPTDHRQLIHQQVFHQPTNNRQPTTDPPTGLPPTHWPPNTNSLTHRTTDQFRTDPPTIDFKTISIFILVTIIFCVCC